MLVWIKPLSVALDHMSPPVIALDATTDRGDAEAKPLISSGSMLAAVPRESASTWNV